MKKQIKTICAAALMTCCMAFPAFAAETRAEYKAEASPVREEITAVRDEIKTLRAENKASSAAYKALREARKNTAEKTDKEDWSKARELRKEIKEIRSQMKSGETTVKALMAEVKADVKGENFDSALEKLKKVSDMKQETLDSVEKINGIWDQIDELIQ